MAFGQYDYLACLGCLEFNLNERPNWRQNGESTSGMVSDIVSFYGRYLELPEHAAEFVENNFAKLMTTKFVFNINVGSSIGTQTADGTQAVLEEYFFNSHQPCANDKKIETDKQETINVYRALEKFFKLLKGEMENTGVLTIERICEVHKELMSGLRDDAGEVRKNAAHVYWNNDHLYPEPMVAKQLFQACIDHHNRHMITEYTEKFVANDRPIASEKAFSYLFKCAARLMFDFVDAHPFGDGNGRMCRLLANYVLSMITPFPVAPYSGEKPGREDYINAVVECRDNRDKGPGTLAAMLVEGAWRGWTSLFNILEQYNLLYPKKFIGPIVVSKSNESRMQKIIDALAGFDIVLQADMLQLVAQRMDDETNTSDKAVPMKIDLSKDFDLILHLYK